MMRASGEISWAHLKGCVSREEDNTLLFVELALKISHACQVLGALLLTMLTAKTYTTQHDGEFLDFHSIIILLLFEPSTFF